MQIAQLAREIIQHPDMVRRESGRLAKALDRLRPLAALAGDQPEGVPGAPKFGVPGDDVAKKDSPIRRNRFSSRNSRAESLSSQTLSASSETAL